MLERFESRSMTARPIPRSGLAFWMARRTPGVAHGRDEGLLLDRPVNVPVPSNEDAARLKRMGSRFSECFMTAPSPGIVATTMLNQHYDSHEAYLMALAKALSHEYRAIHDAGMVLQIDSPDLAMERNRFFSHLGEAEFLRQLELHIVAINLGIEGIPRERVRLHVCWGNNDGADVHDIAVAAILPELAP